jgi:hypothetical protein
VPRLFALLVFLATTAAALPVSAGGAVFGPDARPVSKQRVVATVAVTPAGSHEAGDVVTVTGGARALPKGDRLLVERRSGSAWVRLSECARAVCRATWTEADEVTVAFRSRVVHRSLVTKGRVTSVLTTSRVVTAHWVVPEPPAPPEPPPPPPPPPPAAMAGKYCGFNDQGRTVCLDVARDGLSVTSFVTQSLVTCADGSQWYWLLSFGSRTIALTNLSFTFGFSGPLVSSGTTTTNIQATYSLSGTFDQVGNAQGQIALTSISWDSGGTHYSCSSAPYGWHASLGA